MTAVRLALLELRRFRGPLRRLVPLLLCLIPLLYGAMYLWANWDPYGKTDRIPVAVVNLDRPAVAEGGRPVDAGAQLVEQLKASGTFGWRFVDAGAADAGLREGRYAFTVEIPADFSSRLATAADAQPQQGGVLLRLNDANNYIAGVMTEVVQSKLQAQVDSAVHEAYVRALYGELSDFRQELAVASEGARQLVGATTTARQGSAALASAADGLHAGTERIGAGAQQISRAVGQVDRAAEALDGAVADRLPRAAAQLVTAASVAAEGLHTLHTGTSQVRQGTGTALADLRQLSSGQPELAQDPVFARVLRDAEQADATAAGIDDRAAAADTAAQQQLAAARDLQRTAVDVQQNAAALNAPLRLLDGGAADVAAGTATVADGLQSLRAGADAARSAADQAHDGATRLSTTVDDGLHRIPELSGQQVEGAARVLGTPARIDRTNLHPAGVYGRGMAPFFFGIALWVFGLFAYLLLRPVNGRALAGRARSATVAAAGWLPAALLGAVAALVLYAVVDLTLGLHPVHPWATVALLVLGAASFVAVDHFLRTSLGVPGDVLSLVLLVLQLTAAGGLYPMPTAPAFFRFLHPLLPMTYLIDGLRATVSGGQAAHVLRDGAVLAAFGVLFLGLTTLAVRRQRVWTVARLHPDVEL
ncbi:ABC transporter [Kitasatospora phosalacinea]|uniref:ABC transporter n=1 Tax=Kitasatospora phosalacinea TaxID=2065 RepID=A0A9W6QEV2_9ACTN|nr:YhgE/Pip family protein [Kitasatospora phosalacinea]GLW73764.1 ABC transporter [Kitasatospora phosalacinea]